MDNYLFIKKYKLKIILPVILLLLSAFSFSSFAEDDMIPETPVPTTAPEETTQDNSAIHLIVSDFYVESGSIIPGESRKVKITIKNTNAGKAARNAVFTLTDSSRELIPEGTGSIYLAYLDGSFVWETSVSAVHGATEGRHELTLSAEFEDRYFTPSSESFTLFADVKQPACLDYSSLALPLKVQQDSTVTISPVFMNTGKGELSNIKTDISIEGLRAGGSCYIGTLEAGESKTTTINLQVGTENLGEVNGTATISYSDSSGETYTKTVELSTLIAEKPQVTVTAPEEKTITDKIPLWILITVPAVISALIGAAIPIVVFSIKQRRIDEQRL